MPYRLHVVAQGPLRVYGDDAGHITLTEQHVARYRDAKLDDVKVFYEHAPRFTALPDDHRRALGHLESIEWRGGAAHAHLFVHEETPTARSIGARLRAGEAIGVSLGLAHATDGRPLTAGGKRLDSYLREVSLVEEPGVPGSRVVRATRIDAAVDPSDVAAYVQREDTRLVATAASAAGDIEVFTLIIDAAAVVATAASGSETGAHAAIAAAAGAYIAMADAPMPDANAAPAAVPPTPTSTPAPAPVVAAAPVLPPTPPAAAAAAAAAAADTPMPPATPAAAPAPPSPSVTVDGALALLNGLRHYDTGAPTAVVNKMLQDVRAAQPTKAQLDALDAAAAAVPQHASALAALRADFAAQKEQLAGLTSTSAEAQKHGQSMSQEMSQMNAQLAQMREQLAQHAAARAAAEEQLSLRDLRAKVKPEVEAVHADLNAAFRGRELPKLTRAKLDEVLASLDDKNRDLLDTGKRSAIEMRLAELRETAEMMGASSVEATAASRTGVTGNSFGEIQGAMPARLEYEDRTNPKRAAHAGAAPAAVAALRVAPHPSVEGLAGAAARAKELRVEEYGVAMGGRITPTQVEQINRRLLDENVLRELKPNENFDAVLMMCKEAQQPFQRMHMKMDDRELTLVSSAASRTSAEVYGKMNIFLEQHIRGGGLRA
jgi:phage head maturation protease